MDLFLWYNECNEMPPRRSSVRRREPQEASPVSDPIVNPDLPAFKRCPHCGEIKPREAFAVNRRARTGLASWCKACKAAKYYYSNPEIKRQKSREWYYANREQAIARASAHYEANKPEIAAKKKAYRTANAERLRQKRKAYFSTDRGRMVKKANSHTRRIRKTENGGTFSADDLELIRAGQTDKRGRVRCWWCGQPMDKWQIDHRIPIAKGGPNDAGNICLACPTCNLEKRAKLPTEIGRLL
jgi:5-methylcytosine-specific restriction endonuclease McrA